MYRQARPIYRNMPPNHGNNRIVGGFLGPFILGGITGGLLAPAFRKIKILIFSKR